MGELSVGGAGANGYMVEISWHHRETKRLKGKTNLKPSEWEETCLIKGGSLMKVPRLRFLVVIPMIILCMLSFADSVLYAADIVLTGNDVMTIENTTYTQTGNIYVKDNAKLTIKNATLIMAMSFHEEFRIFVSENATFEIIDSTISHSIVFENVVIEFIDTTTLLSRNANLKPGNVYFIFGKRASSDLPQPVFKGNVSISKTKLAAIDIVFSSFGICTISVTDSEINELMFSFRDNYIGEFSNLKEGLLTSWIYKKNNYDINIQNTTVNNYSMGAD